jgi:hypothetical protein
MVIQHVVWTLQWAVTVEHGWMRLISGVRQVIVGWVTGIGRSAVIGMAFS